jgi:hypothetical protein
VRDLPTELERLVEVEQRSKSNTYRINALETNYDALRKITTSVEVMAVKMQDIAEKVDNMNAKVEKVDKIPDITEKIGEFGDRLRVVEKVPATRWNLLVDKIINGAVAALIGAAVAALWH